MLIRDVMYVIIPNTELEQRTTACPYRSQVTKKKRDEKLVKSQTKLTQNDGPKEGNCQID